MERKDARVSSPGLRRRKSVAVTPSQGKRKPATSGTAARRSASKRSTRPMRECWLTGKRGRKYFQEHHVVLRENDMDLTVWLSRGAHYLVTLLSRYKLIDDPEKLEDLIALCRFQAGLENKRIKVLFEEVN